MELFSINRYTTGNAVNAETNEKQLLDTLLKKVEKRKRKHKNVVKDEKSDVEPQLNEEIENGIDLHDIVANANNVTEENDLLEDKEEESSNTFQILGEDVKAAKIPKVDIVLPPWLAHPSIISKNITDDKDNKEIGIDLPYLAPHIRHTLKELSVTYLFPVQLAVIPWILEAHSKPFPFRPRDICVSAPTGSGKTLAFAIPVVQLLANRVQRKIRALVVLPVAELALQVFKVFKKLCEKTDLTVYLLSKQTPFATEQDKLVEFYKGSFYSKVDILVTTPGRLVEHLHSTKGFCLKSLQFLILDEADRIMDAVFQNWFYHLDEHVRTQSDKLLSGRLAPLCYNELVTSAATQPHKLLFSATLSQDPEKLQNMRLFQPKLFTSVLLNLNEIQDKLSATTDFNDSPNVEENITEPARGDFIGKYTTPAELSEKFCITESRLKPLTLFALIRGNNWKRFLCFTNNAESANRLAFVLQQLDRELKVHEFTANIKPKSRTDLLKNLTRGKINGLICTDAMARGIDIEVDTVISYDTPRHIKTYIHRIGRTARAGRPGTAVVLLTQTEQKSFNSMLTEAGKNMTEEIHAPPNIEEENGTAYANALKSLRMVVEKEKHKKLLYKASIKQQKVVKSDPDSLTFMEQLQLQVDSQVQEKFVGDANKRIKRQVNRDLKREKQKAKRRLAKKNAKINKSKK